MITFADETKRTYTSEAWYAPLNDAQLHFVQDLATLPSASEDYHNRFIEHKMKQDREFQKSRIKAAEQGGAA